MTAHRGDLILVSSDKNGTVFRLTLPGMTRPRVRRKGRLELLSAAEALHRRERWRSCANCPGWSRRMIESAYWCFRSLRRGQTGHAEGSTDLCLEPGPGQALVALRAVGLNQAENRYLRGSHFPPQRFPACLCHEAVGEIVRRWARMVSEPTADKRIRAHSAWEDRRPGRLCANAGRYGLEWARCVSFGVYDLASLSAGPRGVLGSGGARRSGWRILTMGGAMEHGGPRTGLGQGQRPSRSPRRPAVWEPSP